MIETKREARKEGENREGERRRNTDEDGGRRRRKDFTLTSMFLSLRQPRSKETKARHKTRRLQGDIIEITTTILLWPTSK